MSIETDLALPPDKYEAAAGKTPHEATAGKTSHEAAAGKTAHVEFPARAVKGLGILLLFVFLELACIVGFVFGIVLLDMEIELAGGLIFGASMFIGSVVVPILWMGVKIVKPNEARVMTLFGKYIGTLRKDGIYYMNPLATAVRVGTPVPTAAAKKTSATATVDFSGEQTAQTQVYYKNFKISLKTMTLVNEKQKINDLLGNPIVISIIVIWRIIDTAKAVFDVDDYREFLSVQSDSALRNIVRMYPYDSTDDVTGNEKSLRGSSQEIAEKLRAEIQEKVQIAGLEVTEARITHLAYAPEIAAAMLQRQQASAIVDARTLIVEGAVSMVQSALDKLSERGIVELDEERKAAMVSNLLVVLCGNRDAQPIVNSGSLY